MVPSYRVNHHLPLVLQPQPRGLIGQSGRVWHVFVLSIESMLSDHPFTSHETEGNRIADPTPSRINRRDRSRPLNLRSENTCID